MTLIAAAHGLMAARGRGGSDHDGGGNFGDDGLGLEVRDRRGSGRGTSDINPAGQISDGKGTAGLGLERRRGKRR